VGVKVGELGAQNSLSANGGQEGRQDQNPERVEDIILDRDGQVSQRQASRSRVDLSTSVPPQQQAELHIPAYTSRRESASPRRATVEDYGDDSEIENLSPTQPAPSQQSGDRPRQIPVSSASDRIVRPIPSSRRSRISATSSTVTRQSQASTSTRMSSGSTAATSISAESAPRASMASIERQHSIRTKQGTTSFKQRPDSIGAKPNNKPAAPTPPLRLSDVTGFPPPVLNGDYETENATFNVGKNMEPPPRNGGYSLGSGSPSPVTESKTPRRLRRVSRLSGREVSTSNSDSM